MGTAILVHGGLHGAWCWRRVQPLLEAQGWAVVASDLPGMGALADTASPGIGLADHVAAVTALVDRHRGDDLVLLGHSYAGMVLTGVADQVGGDIGTMVFLDAVLPDDGQSMFDVVGPTITATFRERAAAHGDGWLFPVHGIDPAVDYGVADAADAAWVTHRLRPQPLKTFEDALPVGDGLSRVRDKVYVRCTRHAGRPHLDRAMESVEGSIGWRVERWPSVHDVMVTDPARLGALFAGLHGTST